MTLESFYQGDLEQSVRDRTSQIVFGPEPQPEHTWSDLAKAPFEGAASGLLESAATWAPVFRPPGPMLRGGGVGPLSAEQIDQAMKVDIPGQQTELRNLASDVMPDPLTASTASMAVAGFGRFAGKMAGYMGPAGRLGAIPLAIDEAQTEAARLRAQGVDDATAQQAGWQAGAVAGASVLLPMGAATRAGRFAIGFGVGEGGNIAQQASEKFILEHSGYHEQAQTFDPFDPVALAVGAVPGLLGAALPHAVPPRLSDVVQHLESAGRRFGPNGEILQGPLTASGEHAQGDMQVMPKTMTDPGFGVRPADLSGTQEQQAAEIARVGSDYIAALRAHFGDDAKALAAYNWGAGHLETLLKAHPDDWQAHLPAETTDYVQRGLALLQGPSQGDVDAARVSQTVAALDHSRLTAPEDLAGRDFHDQAVQAVFDQMARGDDVAVPNAERLLPQADDARAAADRVQALEDERAQLLGEAGNELGAGEPSALRAQLAELQSQAPDTSVDVVKARAKELQGENVSFKQALGQAQREADAAASQHEASVQRIQEQLDAHASSAQARERIDVIDRQLEAERANAPGPSAPTRLAVAMRAALGEMAARSAETPAERATRVTSLADAVRQLGELRAPAEQSPKPNHAAFHEAETNTPGSATKAPVGETPRAAGETAAAPRETSPLDSVIAQIARDHPDLMVHMDGMPGPMRASEFLEQVREEAQAAGEDSRLLEVAAACALRS